MSFAKGKIPQRRRTMHISLASENREFQFQKESQHSKSLATTTNTNLEPPSLGTRHSARAIKAKKIFDPTDYDAQQPAKRSKKEEAVPSVPDVIPSTAMTIRSRRMTICENHPQSHNSQHNKPAESNRKSTPATTTVPPSADNIDKIICLNCKKTISAANASAAIKCDSCSNKAHPSCIKNRNDTTKWICRECNKKCTVCGKSSSDCYECTQCKSFFHVTCHVPRIHHRANRNIWTCNQCKSKKFSLPPQTQKSKKEHQKSIISSGNSIGSSSNQDPITIENPVELGQVFSAARIPRRRKTVSFDLERRSPEIQETARSVWMDRPKIVIKKSPQPIQRREPLIENPAINTFKPNRVPDVSDWSTQDVNNYFAEIFQNYPKIIDAVSKQEVDGITILRLTKTDCIKYFGLPLGNAIRLHMEVVKLKCMSNDPTLVWRC